MVGGLLFQTLEGIQFQLFLLPLRENSLLQNITTASAYFNISRNVESERANERS